MMCKACIRMGLMAILAAIMVLSCKDTSSGPESETDKLQITSINPNSGPPGTSVTLQGSGFSSIASENLVTFNGVEAGITSVSSRFIKTTVPDDATTGPVKVKVEESTAAGPEFEVITTGALEFTVKTSGPEQDPDGYIVIIDGERSQNIGLNETVQFSDLEKGTREVALDGIAGNCSATGSNPQMVEIIAGNTAETNIEVRCEGEYINPILFVSRRDENEEIYIMNGDGTSQTNLTNSPTNDSDFAVSPDGTQIAFVSTRDENTEIYIMNADGSDQTRLTNNPDRDEDPAWSPEGTQIVFFSNREGTGTGDIFKLNADGTGLMRLTNTSGHSAVEPDWSPDGTKILYRTEEISVINADGSQQTRLTDNLDFVINPQWSPDGSKILFFSDQDRNIDVYVMNADGTNQTNLSKSTGFDWEGAWSPNGTKIAFWSDRDGNEEIYVINVDGTGLTRLTENKTSDTTPQWSPDGTQIVFVSGRNGNTEIYAMNADGTGQTRLTNNFASDNKPVWIPQQN